MLLTDMLNKGLGAKWRFIGEVPSLTCELTADREGNDPAHHLQITYSELSLRVQKFANVLKAQGLSDTLLWGHNSLNRQEYQRATLLPFTYQ